MAGIPFTQKVDFARLIRPQNGNHLGVSLIGLTRARPGFSIKRPWHLDIALQ
jgi:hypothetical protein